MTQNYDNNKMPPNNKMSFIWNKKIKNMTSIVPNTDKFISKIAIISGMDIHFECIGFLCELLREYTISLYVPCDSYGTVKFFCTLFPNVVNIFYNKDISQLMSSHDTVFKLTSNDSIIHNPNIISILHLDGKQDISERFIALTPAIPATYLFPIYRAPTILYYENTITFVGYFTNNWVDNDFDNFINTSNYMFNFVVYAEDDYTILDKYKNISVYRGIQQETLVDLIKSSKFILSRKFPNYDRFSGTYSLAMSFEKPLILNKKTRDIYDFPGIVFEHEYSEIIEQLNMSNDDYDLLLGKVKSFNTKTLSDNKDKLTKLLTQNKILY